MGARLSYACRLAARGVRRHPRSSLMVVVVMALGLAACMTVLTVYGTLATDPLPGRSSAVQTVLFTRQGKTHAATQSLIQVGLAEHLVDRASSMPVMALAPASGRVRPDSGDSPVVSGAAVMAATSRVGHVFGIHLLRGAWWSARDDRDRTPVAVVGQALARRLFGTDDVLGRRIRIGGAMLRIVGVHAPWHPSVRFYAQNQDLYDRDKAQVLMPLSLAGRAQLLAQQRMCPDSDGVSDPWKRCGVAQVWAFGLHGLQRQRLLGLARATGRRIPAPWTSVHDPRTPLLLTVPEWLRMQHVVPDSVRAYVWVALSFFALCLFNAAGMLAARFMRGAAEVGVRRALGASRRDVFAQHVIESGCLAGIAGLLALPLMLGAMALLRAQALDYADLIHFSVGTFVALCLATVLAGIGVGVLPAWRAAVVPPALQVKED